MSADATTELPNPLQSLASRRRPRRRTLLAAGLAALVAAGVGVAVADPFGGSGGTRPATASAAGVTTATVTRRSLASQTQVDATLGYAGAYSVQNLLGAPGGSSGSGSSGSGSSGSPSTGVQTAGDDSVGSDSMTSGAALLTAYEQSDAASSSPTPS
ncbi:MAG: hypothetical protein J2P58_06380, partial [Acidimicrobiaceae bacterium]|nr:hypothetical protein [Acidimicrobiaceae bacterium]